MSPVVKKILLGLLLMMVATGIGLALYFLFIRTNNIANVGGNIPAPKTSGGNTLPTAGNRGVFVPNTSTPSTPGGLPVAGFTPGAEQPSYFVATPVTKINSDYATNVSLNTSASELRYYNAGDGKFYRVNPDGSVTALSDQIFYNAQKTTWAKTKNEAIIEFPDSSKVVYNFDTRKQTTLPNHWQDFSFSPDGSKIAAKSIALSPENRYLVTTRDDNTGTSLLAPMGNNADKVIVDWSPSNQAVALSRTGDPQGFERQEIYVVGLNQENFKSLIVEGTGFRSSWSPTGKKLLYSVHSERSDYKPELWITSAYGDDIGANRKMLQINTWADKCTFGDDTTLFCAVPRDLPSGSGMIPELANGTYDDIYKIDLTTGLKTPLPLDSPYRINSISFDAKQKKLFFTDANQSGLFQIKP